MPWVNGHIEVSHPREPWGNCAEDIFVHSKLSDLKGKPNTRHREQYEGAKLRYDMDAAVTLVEQCVSRVGMDKIIAHVIGGGRNARLVLPHPAFDDEDGADGSLGTHPTNALPFAYAAYLKVHTGCEVDEEIVQTARVGRTKLTRWPRFLYQPSFGGAVRNGQPYIIVDDVVTTGGTFAALRSYIIRNGGSVLFGSAIANSSGNHQRFSMTENSRNVITQALGGGLEPFWLATVGHELKCLTEAEAKFLGNWCHEEQAKGSPSADELLQRLRAEFDSAASKQG